MVRDILAMGGKLLVIGSVLADQASRRTADTLSGALEKWSPVTVAIWGPPPIRGLVPARLSLGSSDQPGGCALEWSQVRREAWSAESGPVLGGPACTRQRLPHTPARSAGTIGRDGSAQGRAALVARSAPSPLPPSPLP
jgi:hypothetical protein